jgi:hypothetical protein
MLSSVFAFTLATHLHVLDRWRSDSRLIALPLVTLLAIGSLRLAARRRRCDGRARRVRDGDYDDWDQLGKERVCGERR